MRHALKANRERGGRDGRTQKRSSQTTTQGHQTTKGESEHCDRSAGIGDGNRMHLGRLCIRPVSFLWDAYKLRTSAHQPNTTPNVVTCFFVREDRRVVTKIREAQFVLNGVSERQGRLCAEPPRLTLD